MGENLASEAASYEQMHLDFHAWMLSAGSHDGSEYTAGSGGVRQVVTDLLNLGSAGYEKTPYGKVTAYNPSDALSALRTIIDAYKDKAIDYSPGDDMKDFIEQMATLVDDKWEDVNIDIDDMVDSYEDKLETSLSDGIGKMNAMFSSMNSVNSSARAFYIAGLELEKERNVADFRSKLEVEISLETQRRSLGKFEAKIRLGSLLLEARRANFVVQAQAISQLVGATTSEVAMQRQYLEDKLRLDLEDTMWDAKWYTVAAGALSAMSGVQVIPARPNPTLETISTGASIIGAVSPLLIEAGKALL